MTENFMKNQGITTRKKILDMGLKLWPNITALGLSKELRIKHSTILYHFPNLKKAIKDYAIEVDDIKVIAFLIVAGDESVANMDNALKIKYLLASI